MDYSYTSSVRSLYHNIQTTVVIYAPTHEYSYMYSQLIRQYWLHAMIEIYLL